MSIKLFNDKRFLKSLLILTLPLILHNFFETSIHILNTSMMGTLGDEKIAAAGIANQIVFIFIVVGFGFNSGISIFIAQYNGAKNFLNIKKMVFLSIVTGIITAIIFTLVSVLIPELILGLFTKDPEVILIGASYLKIISISYLPTALAFSIIFALRSIGVVKIPTIVGVVSLIIGIGLSYLLIFGAFGMPKMGVDGAAIGISISKILEFISLIFVFKRYPKLVPQITIYKHISGKLLKQIFLKTTPVLLNEIAWVMALTIFIGIYSRMGTIQSASANIFITIDKLGIIIFWGMAQASAILIGNVIGEGDFKKAYEYSNITLKIGFISAIFVGIILHTFRVPIIEFFNATDIVNEYTYKILGIYVLLLPVKAYNTINLVGILRSGGDVVYGFKTEILALWIIAIPLCLVVAFYYKLDIKYVYIAQSSEELIKIVLFYTRFKSKKWINNLSLERNN